jgi:2-isopropylmalate synthase
MDDHVRIFDTTLRDGEQAPGCTMTGDEKLAVARQLARLGVDVIEAGFPAASPGDWEAVSAVAAEVGTADGPIICGLARAHRGDIDRCASAVAGAARGRIHIVLATSDIHLEHKLRMSRQQVIDTVAEMVSYASARCEDVEFSPEDAGRSDPAFLHQVLAVAIEAGATTLNIPDTVGYTTPNEYGAMIAGIRSAVPGANRVVISTHCHDDLGMAVANSLAGVAAGARQVECTVNGIGERAGNAALEEVVMALHTRRPLFGIATKLDTRELARTSRVVAAATGVHVPPNKAIVGSNAFAHESGIHQDGVLKHPSTYEIMSAETVGMDGCVLVLGKHSGRHALRNRFADLGYELSDAEFQRVFKRFKEIADKKKVVDERDLEALVVGEVGRPAPVYTIDRVQVACGTHVIPTATVRLRGPDGELRTESAQGTGPVDAVCRSIDRIVGEPGALVDFTVGGVTEGHNAVGEVTMRVRELANADGESPGDRGGRPRVFSGSGVNLDIVVAAADAYVTAINKLLGARTNSARPAENTVTKTTGIDNSPLRERILDTTLAT